MDLFRAHVLVCGGTGCSSSGSAELIKRFAFLQGRIPDPADKQDETPGDGQELLDALRTNQNDVPAPGHQKA